MKNADLAEERVVPRFTRIEEQCIAKCEAKVVKMGRVMERHVDEAFNPQFVNKFI